MQDIDLKVPLPLLRLTSSLLPVGAFAYSRGLEHAVHAGWVASVQDLNDWIFGTLEQSFTTLDGVLFLRMMEDVAGESSAEFQRRDALLAAARESRELQLEDQRMAEALLTLLRELDVPTASDPAWHCTTFPAAFALAASDLGASAEAGFMGLMWSACEAQVSAGIRLGVMGQADGQRILARAPAMISGCLTIAQQTPDDAIGNVAFMVAVGSALHEVQYSRLFTS